jgi:hypothetical protein
MEGMSKEEILARFNKNVAYIEKVIPPDDIYLFTEQTLMAAIYFLGMLNEVIDMNEACKQNPILKKWVINIVSFHKCQVDNLDIELNLDMERMDE